jgi:MFS family permease
MRELIRFEEILNKTFKLFKRCFREITILNAILFAIGFACLALGTNAPLSRFFTGFISALIFVVSLAALSQITMSYAKRKPAAMLEFWKKRRELAAFFGIFTAFFSLNAALSLLTELDPVAGQIAAPLRVLLFASIFYFVINYCFIFQTIFYTKLDFSEALKKSKEIAKGARLLIAGRTLLLTLIYFPVALIIFAAVYVFPLRPVFAAAVTLAILIASTALGCAWSVMFLYLKRGVLRRGKLKQISDRGKIFDGDLPGSGSFSEAGKSIVRSEKFRKNAADNAQPPH